MKRFSLPVYPALLAAWPVVALAAQNPDEISGASDLAVPIGTGVAVAGLGWLIAAPLAREAYRRAAIATAVVFWWWGFRGLVNAVRISPVGSDALNGWWAAVLLAAAIYLIRRRLPTRFAGATPFLNLAAAFLVVIPTTSLITQRARPPAAVSGGKAPALEYGLGDSTARRSVYVIILDGYSGTESLARRYGFDNRPFEEALQQRGFVIPKHFRANYTGTSLAVSALLNWDYIHRFAPELQSTLLDRGLLLPYTEENRTWRFFSAAGYDIVYIPAYVGMSGQNRYATIRLTAEETDFATAWKSMTPIREVEGLLRRMGLRDTVTADPSGEASLHDRRFKVIMRAPRLERPVFVYGHFLLPHEPYVYNADCAHRDPPLWPWHDRTVPLDVDTRAYLDQLACTNRKVLEMVDSVTTTSREPPIILLMSDHGRSSMRFGVLPLSEATKEDAFERMNNFGAFLVPEEHREAFRAVETPVGAMRALMRTVFGLPLSELTEASYWSSSRRPFAFEEMTWLAEPSR